MRHKSGVFWVRDAARPCCRLLNMGTEQFIGLLIAFLGSNGLTAWVSARQSKEKTKAETDSIISATYDKLIEQLTHQLHDALDRIHKLEAKEHFMSARIATLERHLILCGADLPPDAMV